MPRAVIENLFDASHALDPLALRELEAAELSRLPNLVLGKEASRYRSRAMDILVTAKLPRAADLLGQVLRNTSEDPSLRASAAAYLGRLGGPRAETELLRAASLDNQVAVRARISAALGKVGTQRSIVTLRHLSDDDDEAAVRQQARFSLVVVAFRNGIPDHAPRVPSSNELLDVDETKKARAIEIQSTAGEEVATVLRWLGRDTYGLNLAPEHGHRIQCGRSRMVMVMDREHMESGLFPRDRERGKAIGLVARRAEVDVSYSIAWLMLTWRAQNERLYLAAFRPDGRPVLASPIDIEDDRAGTFALKTVRSPGNVRMRITGRYDGQQLMFTSALSETGVFEKRRPMALRT